MVFDVSKPWVIIAARESASVRELAAAIAGIRGLAQIEGGEPPIRAPDDDAPQSSAEILINCDEGSAKRSYAWRTAPERIEIYGHSLRSLDNAVFDFIAALGIGPGEPCVLPKADRLGTVKLAKKSAYMSGDMRETWCVDAKHSFREVKNILLEAGRGGVDRVVFSLLTRFNEKEWAALSQLMSEYHLQSAWGGKEISLFVPRRLFFLHRDLFRMDGGRRCRDWHFCASNNKTLERIAENAGVFFRKCAGTRAYYLLPDNGFEQDYWCSCPACRAFSFEEQYIMAVNSAADVLATLDSEACIYIGSLEAEEHTIQPRSNVKTLFSTETIRFR